jgi:Ca-activated chloride channel homolog
MKIFAALISALLLASVSLFAQSSTSTRPRVAPAATPPTIANDPYKTTTPEGPPVLQNSRNKPSATPTPAPSAVDDDSVIRVETNLVTMPVSVLDRDGRFISGLQQKDFKIFENGVEQKVDYFQSVEQPFTVVMLIDVSPSTQFRIDEIQNAAIAFINQLRPGDRVMVVSFDESVHVLCSPTNNRYELRNAIQQAQFGDGTSLYEAVDFVIDRELRQVQGRKAVVLFTDGVDTTSRRATFESTVAETEEIDSLFYTIRYDTSGDLNGGYGGGYGGGRRRGGGGLGGVLGSIIMGGGGGGGWGRSGGMASSAEYARGKQYLELLAQNSGGREFEAQSMYNLDAAFSGVAEELRRQYSLGYYPETVGKPGDRKQIKIRVMRPGVVVRAKNYYVVGQTTGR